MGLDLALVDFEPLLPPVCVRRVFLLSLSAGLEVERLLPLAAGTHWVADCSERFGCLGVVTHSG